MAQKQDLFDSESKQKRIENVVNASELIHQKIQTESNTNNDDKNYTTVKPLYKRILYPFINDLPPIKNHPATGQIINIEFDDEFEHELCDKNIIELENKNILPQVIKFKILISESNSMTLDIYLENDIDKLKHLLNYYGDGKLDSLIGSEVIIKPIEKAVSRTDEYSVVIPTNKATSKIKAKLTKIRSEVAPQCNEDGVIFNYAFWNIGRFICTLTMITSTIAHLNFIYNDDLSSQSGADQAFAGFLVLIIIYAIMFIISSEMGRQSKYDSYQTWGAIEHSILTYIQDGFNKFKNILGNLNVIIGERL